MQYILLRRVTLLSFKLTEYSQSESMIFISTDDYYVGFARFSVLVWPFCVHIRITMWNYGGPFDIQGVVAILVFGFIVYKILSNLTSANHLR